MSEPKRISDLNELHPLVKQQAEMFLDLCKKNGLNIKVTETYRSQERQDYLYSLGRTRPGSIVTNAKVSNHTSRRAFDVCVNEKGNEYNSKILNQAGELAVKCGLDWGGNWKGFKDTPHYENQNLRPIPKEVDEVKQIKIIVDGKERMVNVIEKDGSNYIKLRDLECDKLNVSYDNQRKLPVVTLK